MQVGHFWPSSVEGWVGLVLALIGITSVLLGAIKLGIKDPLQKDVNGLGDRLKDVEVDVTKNKTDIESLKDRSGRMEGDQRDSSRDRLDLHEDVARLAGTVESLSRMVHDNEIATLEQRTEILERLVRIETKVDVVGGIRDALAGRTPFRKDTDKGGD